MVVTATPGFNEGKYPPICQVIDVKHTTSCDHSSLPGAFNARPPMVVDITENRDLRGKSGREMFLGPMVACVSTWQVTVAAETPPQETCSKGIL
jgi:hypothetical protein